MGDFKKFTMFGEIKYPMVNVSMPSKRNSTLPACLEAPNCRSEEFLAGARNRAAGWKGAIEKALVRSAYERQAVSAFQRQNPLAENKPGRDSSCTARRDVGNMGRATTQHMGV